MYFLAAWRSARASDLRTGKYCGLVPLPFYIRAHTHTHVHTRWSCFIRWHGSTSPWDNISREIARRDLNSRPASFGKTFLPPDWPIKFSPRAKIGREIRIPWLPNIFNSVFRRRLLKRTETRISREIRERNLYTVPARKDWPALLRSHRAYFLRESLKMIDTWIPLSVCSHVANAFAVANLRRGLDDFFFLWPRASRCLLRWARECRCANLLATRKMSSEFRRMFCRKLSLSYCINTSFLFL